MGKIVNPSPAIAVLEEQRLGYFALSMSNWSTTGIPQVIGNVEVAGALYAFDALEDVTGWSGMAAGPVWIKLLPELDGDIAAAWTDVAPAWSDTKQGWYSPTVGEENQRYAFSATKVDASNVTNKREMETRRCVTRAKASDLADLATNATNSTNAGNADTLDTYHANTGPVADTIPVQNRRAQFLSLKPKGTAHDAYTQNTLFDLLAPSIPTTGDTMIVSGGVGAMIASYAYRYSSTIIRVYGIASGGVSAIDLTDGSASAVTASLAW